MTEAYEQGARLKACSDAGVPPSDRDALGEGGRGRSDPPLRTSQYEVRQQERTCQLFSRDEQSHREGRSKEGEDGSAPPLCSSSPRASALVPADTRSKPEHVCSGMQGRASQTRVDLRTRVVGRGRKPAGEGLSDFSSTCRSQSFCEGLQRGGHGIELNRKGERCESAGDK